MIALLRGTPVSWSDDTLVLDVGGVGYQVRATTAVIALAARSAETPITVHIHTVVREDAIQLFGCATEPELTVFERMLGLQGVGPKLALAILSSLSVDQLVRAAQTEDVALLQSVPGVGPKVARRLATELKDRLTDVPMGRGSTTTFTAKVEGGDSFLDARDALVGLGLTVGEAEAALQNTSPELGADERVKHALIALQGARA